MNLKKHYESERSQLQNHTLYDSVYMKCPEKANLEKQKVDQHLTGPGGGNGSDCKRAQEFFLR